MYKDSQFINTCAMWRKLKIADLDDGKYNLKQDDLPLANFGFQAVKSNKKPGINESTTKIIGKSQII